MQKWLIIEAEYLLLDISGTLRDLVTGYSMYSFQLYFADSQAQRLKLVVKKRRSINCWLSNVEGNIL